jgi:hypothetical protein
MTTTIVSLGAIQGDPHWCVQIGNSLVFQRVGLATGSSLPLSPQEITVIALCERIKELEALNAKV